jgi:hypothetical protein
MKSKILNILLIITSLFGYLEWGGNNHSFLFQAEVGIISTLLTDPVSVLHPFTLLPMTGQLVLIITLFQNKPGKLLTYTGIGGLGILLASMFVIGIVSLNYKIVLSTIPFIFIAVLAIRHNRN